MVFVLGGAQTDFARSWSRDSAEPLRDMLAGAVHGALDDAAVPAADVQTAHVGNLAAELFTGQAHLGALLCTLDPAWADLPTSRHEAACASGSMAVLAASAEIEAGRYDVALVAGVELMRNVRGVDAARHLGCAAWVEREEFAGARTPLPWPAAFERIAEEVDERYGLDRAHLRCIAEVNRAHALRNPLAQTRDWTPLITADDDAANPVVTGRMRAADCGRITDGAAAVVLASPGYAREWARRTRRTPAAIRGWGHRTAPIGLEDKLTASRGSEYLFPHLRRAVTDAYARAGIGGADELDAVELHDCFTITEYVALDHLGCTPPGKAFEAVEDGRIETVNPSGGLLGAGHPVGATGVRMLLDATRQVMGRAGDYQVAGAETVATLNIGGSAATVAAFVVGRA